jgi:hypothetical protein
MPTREQRLSEFSTDAPAGSGPYELLCEDKSGTYVLPYPCSFSEGRWLNARSGEQIDAAVIGWRAF